MRQDYLKSKNHDDSGPIPCFFDGRPKQEGKSLVRGDSAPIADMFSAISDRYDLLNRVLSLGRDVYWRKRAAAEIVFRPGGAVLDVAAGTADLSIEIARIAPEDVKIYGVDISEKMMALGRAKIDRLGLSSRIELSYADALALPFEEGRFDSATIAFGIRNMPDKELCLKEMCRVIRPGGRVVVLEMSPGTAAIFGAIYRLYLQRALPIIGGVISGNLGAYRYLARTVSNFTAPKELARLMEKCGLGRVNYYHLTLGIVAIHCGEK